MSTGVPKIAILSDNANSFRKPMAEGLSRLLTKVECKNQLFYDGLRWLQHDGKIEVNYFTTGKFLLAIREITRYLRYFLFLRKIKQFQLIIVVMNTPAAFMRDRLCSIEKIRSRYEIPIVLYDLHYLLTKGPWYQLLKDGDPKRNLKPNNFGMNRYDWYLAASEKNENPLPRSPQPLSVIGLDLKDGTLFQEQEEFIALLDFERKATASVRKLQIRALNETGTKWIELNGQYSIEEIRAIYRKVALYFMASRESFCLPICELQICGSYIVTPYKRWAPAHYIKDSFAPGEGCLSENFIVYDNDLEKLKQLIVRIKKDWKPNRVVRNFAENYPSLYDGDLQELERFLGLFESGKIPHTLHKRHSALECDYCYCAPKHLKDMRSGTEVS